MEEKSHRNRHYLAVVPATAVSLACGTNYAYSAWAPQFAEKLQLSATQTNLIGAAGNMGMYAMGIPLGMVVDRRGPHLNIALGAFVVAGGYYFLRWAYLEGAGSMGITWLCMFSFLTGAGGCGAFQASIKTAAMNWPLHRGTATAFPLAAFGLSALFFTGLSALLAPDSTSGYLLALALGSFCLIFFPVFFIYVPHAEEYQRLASHEPSRPRRDSNALHRPVSWRLKTDSSPNRANEGVRSSSRLPVEDEEASLLSADSSPGDVDAEGSMKSSSHVHASDVTGHEMLRYPDFYLLFMLLGLLTGIGLMTINNIGHDSNALWRYHDPKTDPDFVTRRQLMHVSIISSFSFFGRLISGIGSDFLIKRLHKSRFWCLVVSSAIFALAQFAALSVTSPTWLWLVSSLSGLGYGALFGVYPTLVADTFGVSGLSQNWGYMTVAPVVWGNIFNLLYGAVFDANSTGTENGEMKCDKGLGCYRTAYVVTAIASVVGILGALGAVIRDTRRMAEKAGKPLRAD